MMMMMIDVGIIIVVDINRCRDTLSYLFDSREIHATGSCFAFSEFFGFI